MKPVILVVLDGYGIAPPGPGNAISLANPPYMNSLLADYPNTTLKASGEAVGLPSSEVGNTEVGHINLGAGRVVYQNLPRINMSIAEGSFYQNPAFLKVVEHLAKTGGRLHLIGLIGYGSVHSNLDHLYALLYFAKEHKIITPYIHAITDGRDSPPKSAGELINQLESRLKQGNLGKIATVMGRYFAMDRDRRWERTEKAFLCLTKGKGNNALTALEAIESSYKNGITDEFIEPTVIQQTGLIKENDAVIFMNYRIDRPRQLTKAFVLNDFEKEANIITSFDPYAVKYYKTHMPQEVILNKPFSRGSRIENLLFVTMTEYEKGLTADVAFPPMLLAHCLGKVIADKNIRQLRTAESEKERFVTFYFNGQNEQPFPLEERLIIPSPKIATYDLKPEMSAIELTDLLITKINENAYQFILVNFANADMVGHTGNIEATSSAIKTLDRCIEKIVNTALALDYVTLITADHGNAEQKINPQTGEISTEHTNNYVPFIVIGKAFKGKSIKLQSGILGDVAPTILSILEIEKPHEMTGRNLLEGIDE